MKIKHFILLTLFTSCTIVSFAQRYEKGDKLVTFGIGSGGEKPNELWVNDPLNQSNLINEGQRSYNLKSAPIALAFNGQYFLSPLVSIGAFLSPTSSRAEMSGIYKNLYNVPGDYDDDSNGNDDRYTRSHTETRTLRNFYFGAKCEIHLAHKFGLEDKWDTYTGLSLGSVIKRERVSNRQDIELYEYNVNDPSYYTSTNLIPNSNSESYTWSPNSQNTASFFIGARYFFKENIGVGLELGIPSKYAHLSLAIQL